jgi:hypothetical protein
MHGLRPYQGRRFESTDIVMSRQVSMPMAGAQAFRERYYTANQAVIDMNAGYEVRGESSHWSPRLMVVKGGQGCVELTGFLPIVRIAERGVRVRNGGSVETQGLKRARRMYATVEHTGTRAREPDSKDS